MINIASVLIFIISISLILAGRSMNEKLASFIIGVYASILSAFSLLSESVELGQLLISIIVIFVIFYICSFIAYKIANSIDSDSKFLYVIEWSIIASVPAAIIYFALVFTLAGL